VNPSPPHPEGGVTLRKDPKISSVFALLTIVSGCIMRPSSKPYNGLNEPPAKPRLVVLIIVDQMRADFLDRFSNAFKKNSSTKESEGLQHFYERGTAFINARTASAPTVTAAGHATVCSGATASKHGIVANMFYDRARRELQETAVDSATKLIRTPGMLPKDPLSRVDMPGSSPSRLLTPNLADALHEWSGGLSRTVSVSIKNRGSVYCGGRHSAGVYWYDYQSGSMVTSSSYAQNLPEWVNQFNQNRSPNFNYTWKPSFSLPDLKSLVAEPHYRRALEVRSPLSQKFGSGFPYAYSSAEIGAIGARKFFEYTPFASDYIVDFALEAQKQERLGCGEKQAVSGCSAPLFADLLTVSFSTPDLVGHGFGPESLEHFDIYLNLNKSVERLRKELESRLGSGSVLYVQTSDHGVQTLPEVSQKVKGKVGGRLSNTGVKAQLDEQLDVRFGAADWISEVVNGQVYFNPETIKSRRLTIDSLVGALKPHVRNLTGIRDILSATEVAQAATDEIGLYQRGFNSERSGDAIFLIAEGWLIEDSVAGNHGTSNEDDTRIPMVFAGWRIPKQTQNAPVQADDIAPTILSLLEANKQTFMTGTSLSNLIFKK